MCPVEMLHVVQMSIDLAMHNMNMRPQGDYLLIDNAFVLQCIAHPILTLLNIGRACWVRVITFHMWDAWITTVYLHDNDIVM